MTIRKPRKLVTPITNSVRNPQGIWINTNVFREEAIHFKKYGYYCSEPMHTQGWMEYWEKQLEYCRDGFESCGVRITGHHYFYLNFCNIELVDYDLNKLMPEEVRLLKHFLN